MYVLFGVGADEQESTPEEVAQMVKTLPKNLRDRLPPDVLDGSRTKELAPVLNKRECISLSKQSPCNLPLQAEFSSFLPRRFLPEVID